MRGGKSTGEKERGGRHAFSRIKQSEEFLWQQIIQKLLCR
jgi:hypothetical protein